METNTASNRPQAPAGAAAADRPGAPEGAAEVPNPFEPSAAEVDAWAERERQRRQDWASGPTAAERSAWAQRERGRRVADVQAESASDASDRVRRVQRSARQAQLAAEGALSLLWKGLEADGPAGLLRTWSRRGLDVLVRAGREWEAETARPESGRRVPVAADAP